MNIFGEPTGSFDGALDGNLTTTGNGNIGGDLIVTGDMTVNGTTTTVNTESLTIEDSLIELSPNNPADLMDKGIISHYNDGTEKISGLIQDKSDSNVWKVISGMTGATPVSTDNNTTVYNASLGTIKALDFINATGASFNDALTNISALQGLITSSSNVLDPLLVQTVKPTAANTNQCSVDSVNKIVYTASAGQGAISFDYISGGALTHKQTLNLTGTATNCHLVDNSNLIVSSGLNLHHVSIAAGVMSLTSSATEGGSYAGISGSLSWHRW